MRTLIRLSGHAAAPLLAAHGHRAGAGGLLRERQARRVAFAKAGTHVGYFCPSPEIAQSAQGHILDVLGVVSSNPIFPILG
jgi:hypothetical protein